MATTSELYNLSHHEFVHVSHHHPLILIDDFDSSRVAAPLVCCICETPIIGVSPAYTCSLKHSPCSFFLHKRCAESSPKRIVHHMHPQHQLDLFERSYYLREIKGRVCIELADVYCAACTRQIYPDILAYNCRLCELDWVRQESATIVDPFALCARCALMESVLDHEGHHHSLTLLHRTACFSCDACGIKAEEFGSYICHSCHFWIHSSCAAYPRTIKLRIHEDDTLQLIYSIPEMYRRFIRHCPICSQGLEPKNWAYFCEESGYFVHIKCAAELLASGKNVIETEDDNEQTYSDLLQFPLPRIESLVQNLIAAHRSGKWTHQRNAIEDEVDKLFLFEELEDADHNSDDDDNDTNNLIDNGKESPLINHRSTHPERKLFLLEELEDADHKSDDDDETDTNNHIDDGKESPLINHRSHPEHKLFLLEELEDADHNSDNDERDTDDRIDEMLVCDGCVQPISTASNKRYYGCIGCNYFLHTTCANHLPLQSRPGDCPQDPQHILKLHNYNTSPLETTLCCRCNARTNGFTYRCSPCKNSICISCYLTPHKIKHEYHKHPLVQREATWNKTCNACLQKRSVEYGCESCSDIQIHLSCAVSFPKTIHHRWDSHSISLIYPPIYYKGLRYCEKCELEVNPEAWLYRCSECDQFFHPLCIRQPHLKLGHTIDPSITHTFHPHPLTLKMIYKNRYPQRLHKSLSCRERICLGNILDEPQQLVLECAGCNYIMCLYCSSRQISLKPLKL
ncbi:uncharacterized protein LOC108211932 [Daucus carota subsp. sativus]|uniref:uncharacterized protein LOC108211932 n=1 Tax=Daucus carota subsp. sativus TaxID=79200 RepID=UPI0007EF5198|nr:PREDICTED: uncharacterized protein LOC108211932 [Daucus carota subsp. sativus]